MSTPAKTIFGITVPSFKHDDEPEVQPLAAQPCQPTFVCNCGATMPQSDIDSHTCPPPAKLPDHIQRHLDRLKAKAAAELKAMNAPRPCPDLCGKQVTPGVARYCTPPQDQAYAAIADANRAGLLQLLKSNGITAKDL